MRMAEAVFHANVKNVFYFCPLLVNWPVPDKNWYIFLRHTVACRVYTPRPPKDGGLHQRIGLT